MKRMRQLVTDTRAAYPRDPFFADLDEVLRQSSQARAQYRTYDRVLSCLDDASWVELSRKAIAHFRDHRVGQLKQGFFNQLNEAFAYQFLLRRGHTGVSILHEDGNTTPDIAYDFGTERRYCEVKSIGISQEEIARSAREESFDASVYRVLSTAFLRKLGSHLSIAHTQITSRGGTGLVFVVARFDDFTLAHYDRYREQIVHFLSEHPVPEVYIKVGLLGGKHICKQQQGRVNT